MTADAADAPKADDPRDPNDPTFPLLLHLHGKSFALEGKIYVVRMAVPRPVGLSQYVNGVPRVKLDPETQPDSIALIAVPIAGVLVAQKKETPPA